MNSVECKERAASTDFEQCRKNFREATGEMFHAVLEHGTEDQARTFHESLVSMHEQIEPIDVRIKAEKHKERMDELTKRMPNEGDEVFVDVCPCGDETWIQVGKVLLQWHDDEPADFAVWAAIEITRSLTDEENDRYWSDDNWIGSVFVCHLSCDGSDWRAHWPANDRARMEWRCDEADE